MIVPIFPLPNVVFFPRTLLPLHVFEQRYREMTREALAGDRQIVMVLLREGWETQYEGRPAVHEIACLGRIQSYEVMEDGRYNIVLSGVSRVRLLREVNHTPYRLAEVELLQDAPPDDDSCEIVDRRNHLAGLFSRFAELANRGVLGAPGIVTRLSFESLVNMAASSLNIPAEEKQELLEMNEVVDRCDVLIPVLQRQVEALMLVRRFEHLKPEDSGRN